MDSDQFQQLPAAPYPAPPPFWKYFTSQNVERIQTSRPGSELPFDLNCLRPPPPPSSDADSYTTFSIPLKLDPTPALPPLDILLFDPNSAAFDHARALRQLTHSLLLNFLELTTVLSNDPVKYEEKLQDIERLMLNVHFVINLYRPHQAREGVKEMLTDQLESCKTEIAKCDEMKEKVALFLKQIEQHNQPVILNGKAETVDTIKEDNKKLWNLIHSLKDD